MRSLPKSKAGAVLTASELNRIKDAIKQNNAELQDQSRRLGAFVGEAAIPAQIHNALGRDIELGECIGLGDQVVTDNLARRVLAAEEIDEDKHRRRFAIAGKLFIEDVIQTCYIGGMCLAKVNVESADHVFATPRTGETYLCSDVCGPAVILWAEDGTGEKWAVVYIKPHIHGTSDAPFQNVEKEIWDIFNQPEEHDGIEFELKARETGSDGEGDWIRVTHDSLGHLVLMDGDVGASSTTPVPTTTEPPPTTTDAPTTTFHDWPTPTPTPGGTACGVAGCDYQAITVTLGSNLPNCIPGAMGTYTLIYEETVSGYCHFWYHGDGWDVRLRVPPADSSPVGAGVGDIHVYADDGTWWLLADSISPPPPNMDCGNTGTWTPNTGGYHTNCNPLTSFAGNPITTWTEMTVSILKWWA